MNTAPLFMSFYVGVRKLEGLAFAAVEKALTAAHFARRRDA